jgi:hypothetical protein
LSNRKDILKLAVSCAIESIIRNPDKYNLLVRNGHYLGGQYASPHPNFAGMYRALILEDAEKLFEVMVRSLISKVVS